MLWKLPALSETTTLKVVPIFPEGVRAVTPMHSSYAAGTAVQRWRIEVDGGLADKAIEFANLSAARIDVLVRLERADGTVQLGRVLPLDSRFVITTSPGPFEVVRTYTVLGIEHILLGFDHLLFVLALLLLVRGGKRVVLTITAFTVAHSITLAMATLGWFALRGPPVEATIALSIVFLAREIAMTWRGHASLTERMPWLVAFIFGLLHGLGFAGALAEIGLPQNSIPLALLCFNLGVEAGQLMFVGAVLAAAIVSRRWLGTALKQVRWLPPYAIGGIASYWLIARLAAFAT